MTVAAMAGDPKMRQVVFMAFSCSGECHLTPTATIISHGPSKPDDRQDGDGKLLSDPKFQQEWMAFLDQLGALLAVAVVALAICVYQGGWRHTV